METVKINYNKPIMAEKVLKPLEIFENGTDLYLVLDGYLRAKPGNIINFRRSVKSESFKRPFGVAIEHREVKSVSYVEKEGKKVNTVLKMNFIDKTRLDVLAITENGRNKMIEFNTMPNIFAQDVIFARQKGFNPTILSFDDDGNYIDIATNLRFSERIVSDREKNREYIVSGCQEAEKFVFDYWNTIDYKDCGTEKTVNPTIEPMYYYIPFKGNELTIWADFYGDISNKMLYYKYNSFYLKEERVTTSKYDRSISGYRCYIWEDVDMVNGIRRKVKENGVDLYNHIVIALEAPYWNVPVGLSQEVDYTHLYQETNVREVFADRVINDVIESAPVIDMEKVKYAPYYLNSNGKYAPLNSITYNLHFRVRNIDDEGWQYTANPSSLWNSGVTPSNLVNNNWSDMLYYLGFDDSDVQNQKAKLKKSFIRLSFYDSKDPLTQKLLHYSTIFMDTGLLFGKYIKAKNQLLKDQKIASNVVLHSSDTDYRLDCQFVVRDEFFTEKSSEGFNIYYFPDAIENGERTIYMRVDFNHAKYGRTIPMIIWPSGKSVITLEEAKEGLYIPITINLIEKEDITSGERTYIYTFKNNEFITLKDNTITLNLVEPKLD